jgi:hypothetical protein
MANETTVPPAGYVRLHGSERSPRPGFRATGPVAADEQVRVVLKVRPRQQPPDPAVLGAVRPSERGPYPSRAEFYQTYGATSRRSTRSSGSPTSTACTWKRPTPTRGWSC